MKRPPRKPLSHDVALEVLRKSRRKCALCFGLDGDLRLKKGQIAHLDKNRDNNDPNNLAWLCLSHHDDYDSKSGQSRGFTIWEVQSYRDELYEKIAGLTLAAENSIEVEAAITEAISIDDVAAPEESQSDAPPVAVVPDAATSVAPPATPTLDGSQYTIIKKIGEGSSGDVFRALDRRLERIVAIKVLPKESAALGEALHRFIREARALARCDHANIVRIHDINTDGEHPYIVMEYVDGLPLRLAHTTLGDCSKRLSFLSQLAQALAYAHDREIIHRDLNPNNVLVARDGSPKIIDFGWTKLTDAKPITRTSDGGGIGTPNYISPEQLDSYKNVTRSTDIYSFGCILHFALLGKDPTLEASFSDIDARCRQLVVELYTRCVQRSADLRPHSMSEVVAAIDWMRTKLAGESTPEQAQGTTTRLGAAVQIYLRTSSKNKLMSVEEIKKVLLKAKSVKLAHAKDGIADSCYPLFVIMANTGLLLSEAVHLRCGDLKADRLVFTRRKLQALLPQDEINVNPVVASMLKAWIGKRPKEGYMFPGRQAPCFIARQNGPKEQVCDGGHISLRCMQRQWREMTSSLGVRRIERGISSLTTFAKYRLFADEPNSREPIL